MNDESNAGERDVSQPTEAPQSPKPEIAQTETGAPETGDGDKPFVKKPFVKKAFDKKGFDKKDGAKPAPKATERIAKVLARAGLASRREVERLIGLGKIAVNGRILETPAVLVSSADIITVDGQVIGKAEPTRVWRYHKPVGLITTHSDPQGRPTLFEQLPSDLPRVISVGRLDLNSEGLLLLTNDGELARSLEKPSSGWVRRYRVRALGHTSQQRLDSLKHGTTVEGVIYGPMEAVLDKMAEKADGRANVWLTVAITEGKNREVRKVLESLGLKVNRLIRLAYGPFQLGNLESGEVEEVGPRVIRELLGDMVALKNLPVEGASQTMDAPRDRGSRDGAGRSDGPAGRRGGGDRFEAKAPRGKPGFGDKREYKPRDFADRPRFAGDGQARDRKPTGEDARSTYTPRPDRGAGSDRKPYDKKPYAPRPAQGEAGAYDRAKREFGDKPRFDRPKSDDARSGYSPRPDRGSGDAAKPYAKKPYAPKPYAARPAQGEAGAYDRAKREFGDKPRFDRPSSDRSNDRPSGDRPRGSFAPRPDRGAGGGNDRPKRDFADRPSGNRPAGDRPRGDYAPRPDRDGGAGGYKKPYAARAESGEGGGYNRAKREFTPRPGAKPRFDRPAGDGARSDYTPRPDREGSGGGFKKPYAPRKPQGATGGDRPAYKGRDGAPAEGRKSYGDRPSGGDRPGGARPGGRSTGKPAFGRKPPRDS